ERLVHVFRIARSLWFVRLNRSGKSIWTWLMYSRYSHLFRIAWMILFILLVAHYMACVWFMLGGRLDLTNSAVEAYASSLYDALQLLQGQGIATTTISQSIFASFSVLLGSIVLAIVFGHVAVLVANFNANSTSYQRKMEAVFAITSKMQLPEPLRERIHQYYDHLWREYESLDGEIERFSKNLSHTLELEVVLCKYMDLIMGIPFWVDCSPDFQKQLMLSLRVRVYMPDDFIMRRGEVDEEFYMINRGSVELATGPDSFERSVGGVFPLKHIVRSSHLGSHHRNLSFVEEPVSRREDKYVVDPAEKPDASRQSLQSPASRFMKTLKSDQAFGEMALLMNYERTANARAMTYVELCVLSRVDFQKILTKHPVDRKRVVSVMLSSCMISNEVNGVYCPLTQMVRAVYNTEGDVAKAAEISAEQAAALIAEVINPDLEDRSIKFGVDLRVKQLLVEKRDRDLKALTPSASSGPLGTTTTEPAPTLESAARPSSLSTEASREQQAEPGSTMQYLELKGQLEQVVESQQMLTNMLVEMRFAVNQLSFRAAHRRPSTEKRHLSAARLQFESSGGGASSSSSARSALLRPSSDRFPVDGGSGSRRNSVSRGRHKSSSNASVDGDADPNGEAAGRQRRPSARLQSVNVVNSDSASRPSMPRRVSQTTLAPLLKRMGSLVGLSAAESASSAVAAAAASPTQYADQLFK
ncbi:Voltage-gated ion channel, partial [Globisporangium polare]